MPANCAGSRLLLIVLAHRPSMSCLVATYKPTKLTHSEAKCTAATTPHHYRSRIVKFKQGWRIFTHPLGIQSSGLTGLQLLHDQPLCRTQQTMQQQFDAFAL